MIYIYNETAKAQWKIYEKNSSFLRLENKFDRKLGFDIRDIGLEREDFSDDALGTTNNTKITMLCDKKTSVVFERKALLPFVIAGDKYNTDVIIATFDLSDGRRILNHRIREGNVYTYSYDLENQTFTVIFTLNTGKRSPSIQEIFRDEEHKMIYRKVIYWNDRQEEYGVNSRELTIAKLPPKGERGYINVNDESIDNGNGINIRCYTPSRPTWTVIVTKPSKVDDAKKILEERYHMTDNRLNLIVAKDSKELRDEARSLREKEHVKAVTYFIDNVDCEKLRADIDNYAAEIENNKFGTYFNKIFALTNDGMVSRLKVN